MTASNIRVALVTGASEGIGRALALELGQRGDYQAIVVTARSQSRLDSLVAELERLNVRGLAVAADLTDASAARRIVDETLGAFGRLDALFNNAGATMWAPFQDIADLGVFRQVMEINYFAVVNMTQAALPALIASRGRLVAISSVAGLTGVPTRSGYSASKHAVNGFFESLRIELRDTGVSVTIVAPDFVVSQIHKRALKGDGTPLGTSPMRESRIMTAQQCAARIARSAQKRERLHITSLRGRAGRWLRLVAPGVIDRIAARAIQAGH